MNSFCHFDPKCCHLYRETKIIYKHNLWLFFNNFWWNWLRRRRSLWWRILFWKFHKFIEIFAIGMGWSLVSIRPSIASSSSSLSTSSSLCALRSPTSTPSTTNYYCSTLTKIFQWISTYRYRNLLLLNFLYGLRALSWQIVTIWMIQKTRDTSTQFKPWIAE